MEDLNKIVATNLIELRKNANLTQQQFAAKLNYSNKTISKWELGYAIPNVETLKEIADFYNVPLDYFVISHENDSNEKAQIKTTAYKISMMCLIDVFFLTIAAIIFVAYLSFADKNFWPVFLWAIAFSFFFNAIVSEHWWYKTPCSYIFGSFTIWTLLISLYFTLIVKNINYNFWYLFFVGLPIQVALILILGLIHSNKKKDSKL